MNLKRLFEKYSRVKYAICEVDLNKIREIKRFEKDGYKIVGIDLKEYYLNSKIVKLPLENAEALNRKGIVKILKVIQ